jgi:quercetin dioxygenase-like cupin family protein
MVAEGGVAMESTSLSSLADEELTSARAAASGRSARTIHGGHHRSLRETVIALASGRELSEHEGPGEATLQVLKGRVRLVSGQDTWEGGAGGHVIIPEARHALVALEDAVVLLTVVKALP